MDLFQKKPIGRNQLMDPYVHCKKNYKKQLHVSIVGLVQTAALVLSEPRDWFLKNKFSLDMVALAA